MEDSFYGLPKQTISIWIFERLSSTKYRIYYILYTLVYKISYHLYTRQNNGQLNPRKYMYSTMTLTYIYQLRYTNLFRLLLNFWKNVSQKWKWQVEEYLFCFFVLFIIYKMQKWFCNILVFPVRIFMQNHFVPGLTETFRTKFFVPLCKVLKT